MELIAMGGRVAVAGIRPPQRAVALGTRKTRDTVAVLTFAAFAKCWSVTRFRKFAEVEQQLTANFRTAARPVGAALCRDNPYGFAIAG